MRTRKETYSAHKTIETKTGLSVNSQGFKTRAIRSELNSSNFHPVALEQYGQNPSQVSLICAIQNFFNVTKITSEMNTENPLEISKNSVGYKKLFVTENATTEEEMKSERSNSWKMAVIAIMSISMAFGQGAPKLELHVEDSKVNLTAAEIVDGAQVTYSPGDTIQYVLTASNVGTGLMTDPEIVDPIPAGVTYVPKSARGDNTEISYSLNQGGTYMAWPPTYTVRNSKGILIKREATPEMITHIKWAIQKDLQPGEKSTMEFLVEVNN